MKTIIGSQSGGTIASSGDIAYVGGFGTIAVYDLANAADPQVLPAVTFPAPVQAMAASADRLVVAGSLIVAVYDITTPSMPVLLGQLDTDSVAPNSIAIDGDHAFTGTSHGSIDVFEIGSGTPKLVGQASSGDVLEIVGVVVNGKALYAGGGVPRGMLVFDVSTPSMPVQMPTVEIGGKVQGLALDNGALFTSTLRDFADPEAQRFDLGSPLAPRLQATSNVNSATQTVADNLQVTTAHGRFIVPAIETVYGWDESKLDAQGDGAVLCLPEQYRAAHVHAVGDVLVVSGQEATGFYAP